MAFCCIMGFGGRTKSVKKIIRRKRIFSELKAYLRPPRTIPLAILLVEIWVLHVCSLESL
jgi:hypothetical protein